MTTSLEIVRKLQRFLIRVGEDASLSSRAVYALNKDKKYVEKCIDVLSSDDTERTNDLWREVQYFSRFFGEGYAEGADQRQLLDLMDEFETALLDDVVAIRAKT